MKSAVVLLFISTLLVSFTLVSSASAAPVSCGMTITKNTKLHHDLTCPGNGIIIGANGITLNCDGHAIVGPGANSPGSNLPVAVGIEVVNVQGVTVKNCRISSFFNGIDFGCFFSLPCNGLLTANDTLRNNIVSGSVTGFVLDTSDPSPDFNTVVNNTSISNKVDGFFLSLSNQNVLTGNIAEHNPRSGFTISNSNMNSIASNVADHNGGAGFELGFGASMNFLASNVANYNGGAVGFTTIGYGFFDNTVGSGTSGTANTYTRNTCVGNVNGTSVPVGLCA